MTKHTPGPWYYNGDEGNDTDKHGHNVNAIPEGSEDGAIICEISEGPHAEANARLIKASPRLLNACLAVINSWEKGDLAAAARMCNEAIKEATGK
jgi:hypothetical protein